MMWEVRNFHLTIFPLLTIFLLPHSTEGRFPGRLEVRDGRWRLRARRKTFPRALGRFWVTVRPHYGALPSTGWTRNGQRRAKARPGRSLQASAVPGSTVPKTEIATVERREAFPRPLCVRRSGQHAAATEPKSRLSALRLPRFGRPLRRQARKYFAGGALACSPSAAV